VPNEQSPFRASTPMIGLRLIAYGLAFAKFLVATWLILLALFFFAIGAMIVGPGGEGPSPIVTRLYCTCVIIVASAIGYPFSMIRYRGAWNWVIATLPTLPFGYLLLQHEFGGFHSRFAIAGFVALLVWAEFILSMRIHASDCLS
jgi:hypothetical protein